MKKLKVLGLTLALAGVFTLGAAAAVTAQQITAELRPDIKVTLDGKRQELLSPDGGAVAPILFNGTTYLPVRAISTVLGKDVDWDQKTQTVILTTPTGETGKGTTGTVDASYETRIAELERKAGELEKAATWDRETYRTLDRETDALDDELERAYRAGTLTREQYRALDDRLDRVDDRLDHVEDRWDLDD